MLVDSYAYFPVRTQKGTLPGMLLEPKDLVIDVQRIVLNGGDLKLFINRLEERLSAIGLHISEKKARRARDHFSPKPRMLTASPICGIL